MKKLAEQRGLDPLVLQEAFRARMEKQCAQIEGYKLTQQQQGRSVTTEEAAREWIERYAASFEPLFPQPAE